jgi:hypothetical protein
MLLTTRWRQAKKDALEKPVAEGKEKRMEVCDVCCNLMSEGDKEGKTPAAQVCMFCVRFHVHVCVCVKWCLDRK